VFGLHSWRSGLNLARDMPWSENFAAFLNKASRSPTRLGLPWRNIEHIPTVHQLLVCDNAGCGMFGESPGRFTREPGLRLASGNPAASNGCQS